MRNVFLVPLAAVLICALTRAQDNIEPLRVEVRLVNISFVAKDASGALASDLNADDIEVFEDGVKQPVKFFSRSADLPLTLGVLVDASESQSRFLKQHRHDLQTFLSGSLTPRDRAVLVCFGDHIRVASDFTHSANDLMDALNAYEKRRSGFPELDPDNTRDGGTALFDAVYAIANSKMKRTEAERKAIVLFSDGEDNSSGHDLLDAIAAAQDADALIYAVRYTRIESGRPTAHNRYGIREMGRFATETGGVVFDSSAGDLPQQLRQVADELRSIYEVGYTSTNRERDGTFRKVTIRCKRDGVSIRAKPGYFSK